MAQKHAYKYQINGVAWAEGGAGGTSRFYLGTGSIGGMPGGEVKCFDFPELG